MSTLLDRFFDDEAGATAVEYGLIAALVSVAAIGALQAVGTSVAAVFSMVSSTLSSASVAGLASAP
jgi:pilus assembly protein Flp/PilA